RSDLLASPVVHMAGWIIGVAEVLIVFACMGHPVSIVEAVVIESLLHAIRGAAFAIPGALGAQEGGLVLLCAAFGIPPEQAIALSLVKRAADLVLGGPGLLGWQMLEMGRLIPGFSLGARHRRESVNPGSKDPRAMILIWSSVTASLIAVAGCGFLIAATIQVARAALSPPHPRTLAAPSVTVLKPLHGDEPGLLDNLGSFCSQDYPGPIQVVFGVHDPRDGAVAVVEHLQKTQAAGDLDLVIDGKVHGLNRKISNL